MKNKKIRESNIELLRILLILMVIGNHYFCTGMGNGFLYTIESAINVSLSRLICSFCIVSVDAFILITGYFQSSKKSINKYKVIEILLLMFTLKAITYLLDIIVFNNNFKLSIFFKEIFYGNWFIVKYLILYIMSPYINKLINSLNKNEYKRFIILVTSFFIIIPTILNILSIFIDVNAWAPIYIIARDNGYTLVNFFALYVIGAYIKKNNFEIKKTYSILGYIICSLIIFITWYLIYKSKYNEAAGIAYYYNNIFVVLSAIFIFIFFNKLKISNNKIINTISNTTLSVFIVSTTPLFIKIYSLFNIKKYVITKLLIPHFIITCVIIFILSSIIGLITLNILKKSIFKILNKKTLK